MAVFGNLRELRQLRRLHGQLADAALFRRPLRTDRGRREPARYRGRDAEGRDAISSPGAAIKIRLLPTPRQVSMFARGSPGPTARERAMPREIRAGIV